MQFGWTKHNRKQTVKSQWKRRAAVVPLIALFPFENWIDSEHDHLRNKIAKLSALPVIQQRGVSLSYRSTLLVSSAFN